MKLQSTAFKTIIVIGLVGIAAACTAPSAAPGPDLKTRSEMSTVTWADGKPAYSISCEDPAGCQQRAQAVCSAGYTTLKSENMPTAGTVRAALGKPSVVVRCGS